jgi:hypothetical protein
MTETSENALSPSSEALIGAFGFRKFWSVRIEYVALGV